MTVPISKFKAKCLATLEGVNKTGKPLRVTRFGKPLVDIVPATVSAPPSWLGLLQGDGEILGDIMDPVLAPESWEVIAEPACKSPAKKRKRSR